MVPKHRRLQEARKATPPPLHIRGSTAPLTPWLWTSGLQTRGAAPFCCCKPPSLWCFVTAALGNEYKVIAMSAGHWSLAWKAHPGLTPSPLSYPCFRDGLEAHLSLQGAAALDVRPRCVCLRPTRAAMGLALILGLLPQAGREDFTQQLLPPP